MKNQYNKSTIAAILPMAGAIVTAAILLSGLSLIGSYPQQRVLAQQEGMTGTGIGGGTTGGDGGSMTGVGGATGGGGNATNMTGGGAGAAQGNDSISQVRLHLEEARTALQNNDTQGALMHLDLALNALGTGNASGISSNITTGSSAIAGDTPPTIVSENPGLYPSEASSDNDDDSDRTERDADDEDSEDVRGASSNNDDDEDDDDSDRNNSNTDDSDRTERDADDEDSECGAVNIGGTSPADDYGCPPDDDGA